MEIAPFEHYLRAHAATWYPELSGPPVPRWTGSRLSRTTQFLRFDLEFREGIRPVVVKVLSASPSGPKPPFAHWPRLVPSPDREERSRAEFAALRTIAKHFDALGDPALRSVRALDVLPERRALVLELVPGTTLSRLAPRLPLFLSSSRRALVQNAFESAGRWLRAFHAIPDDGGTVHYRSSVALVVSSIHELSDYLLRMGQPESLIRKLAERGERLCREFLSAGMVMRLGHGDFWPGNLLVGSDGSVCAIDTYARSRTPVFEDLAYFLATLRSAPCQVATGGRWISPARMRQLESGFLRGYFGEEPIPRDAIRPFEVLSLLNTWAIRVHSVSSARGVLRPLRVSKFLARRRHTVFLLQEAVAGA